MDLGIITFAYGAHKYAEMAKALARSLKLHSPEIPRAVVTNHLDDDELCSLFNTVIPYRPEYGTNVRQKVYIDAYSPYKRTLFIDSDCIVVRDLTFAFDAFAERSFSPVGERYLKRGDRDKFINVDSVLRHFGLEELPKFNGGVYYFDDSETSKAIFQTARDILNEFKELGFFVEFRNDGPNDEPIFAIAMALHGQTMLSDGGSIMRTPIGLRGSLDVDVLKGKCTFKKYSSQVSPAILHFAYIWNSHPIYIREVMKLQANANGNQLAHQVKVGFRPILHHQINVIKYALNSATYRIKDSLRYGKA